MLRMMRNIKYITFETLSKVAPLKGFDRSEPAVVGFSVHCEKIYDGVIYRALLQFSKYFFGMTGKRLIVCTHSPLNPVTQYVIKNIGLKEAEYKERLDSLREFCDLGYHGHFYRKKKEGEYSTINEYSPHSDVAVGQIRQECGWFRDNGFTPRKYIAGWWYLNKDIVLELEAQGFETDFSMRCSGKDTFGCKYLQEDERLPVGDPFILPPSKRIIEIQTVFGPTSHPYRVGQLLGRFMRYGKDRKIYFVFSMHDWDLLIFDREIRASIEFVTRARESFQLSDFNVNELDAIRSILRKKRNHL